MAKVTGPLMSMDASGSIANTLTFSKWAGRNYVRQHVIPSNPQSAAQMAVRNRFEAMGKAAQWAGLTAMVDDSLDERDADLFAAIAPADQRWNGYAVSIMTRTAGAAFTAAMTAWDGLDTMEKDAWDTAADALAPPMQAAPQLEEGGVSGTPLTTGNVLFLWRWAMYVAGIISAAPSATPPSYSAP